MTPLKAIRQRCADCQPIRSELDKSLCKECQLKNYALTNLKKIKAYCKWCCNKYSPKDWCSSPECSLYIYRFGKNPSRQGIGGKLNKNTEFDACE